MSAARSQDLWTHGKRSFRSEKGALNNNAERKKKKKGEDGKFISCDGYLVHWGYLPEIAALCNNKRDIIISAHDLAQKRTPCLSTNWRAVNGLLLPRLISLGGLMIPALTAHDFSGSILPSFFLGEISPPLVFVFAVGLSPSRSVEIKYLRPGDN